MDKFNELLAKYGKTADEVTFEYENLSDEELEVAFKEAFGEVEGAAKSYSLVAITEGLSTNVKEAFKYDNKVIIEKFIKARGGKEGEQEISKNTTNNIK